MITRNIECKITSYLTYLEDQNVPNYMSASDQPIHIRKQIPVYVTNEILKAPYLQIK